MVKKDVIEKKSYPFNNLMQEEFATSSMLYLVKKRKED